MKKGIIFLLLALSIFCFSPIAHADTAIHLEIRTADETLYDDDISVAPCDTDQAGTMNITPYCAILQSGLENSWTWYGTDAFLESIGSSINNEGENGIYWNWFNNLELGEIALNKYALEDDDSILLTYGINPLKISVDNENPEIGEVVEFAITEFGYDASWNPSWNPAAGGEIVIGAEIFVLDENGLYSFTIRDDSQFTVRGQKNGFLDTREITITPQEETKPRPQSGGGGRAAPSIQSQKTFNPEKALEYLFSQQKEDGSFGEDLYTDWAALAVASFGERPETLRLKTYLEKDKLDGNLLTDYERRAMALLALGINPHNLNGENYIEKIASFFDGKQFGDPKQDNEDIFALIVLLNTGYGPEETIIKNTVSSLLEKQKENGSWDESVDLTSAAIASLANFYSGNLEEESLIGAREFLKKNQEENGGWGNISSTAWALQGMLTLGEKTEDSTKKYFGENQGEDGGIKEENINNRIWQTSYVLASLSGKTWNQIMQKFEKPSKETIPVHYSQVVKKPLNTIKKMGKPKENLSATIASAMAPENIPEQKEIPRKNWFGRLLDKIFSVF